MSRTVGVLAVASLALAACDQLFPYAATNPAADGRAAEARDRGTFDGGPGRGDGLRPGDAAADSGGRDAAQPDGGPGGDLAGDAPGPDAQLADGPPADVLPADVLPADTLPPLPCACALGEVCTTGGQCIPRPIPAVGDFVGELVLLRQERPSAPLTNLGARMAKASARFYAYEPLPTDTRQTYATADGETCVYDTDPYYPGAWPSGPRLTAGKLSFAVQGAPSPIELEVLYSTYTGDYYYSHAGVPPALTDGTTTYSGFFEVKYLPFGASSLVTAAGDLHVGPTTWGAGELPETFTVLAPDIESGIPTIASGNALTVTWTPPQPNATMRISIASTTPMSLLPTITCVVKDDGQTVIPAAAMLRVSSPNPVGFQLLRRVARYERGNAVSGKPLHLFLWADHARVGSLSY